MGVNEFWRYNGKSLTIYQLKDSIYQDVSANPLFPWVAKERLYQFLDDCAKQGETQAKRKLRAWVREQIY